MGSWQRPNSVCGEPKLPLVNARRGGRGVSTLVVAAAAHMFCVKADKDAVNGIRWSELFIKDSFSYIRIWRKYVENFWFLAQRPIGLENVQTFPTRTGPDLQTSAATQR